MKIGDKIRVLQMEDYDGVDYQAARMNGNIYTIDYIDCSYQIHLQESGLAVIPGVDKFVLLNDNSDFTAELLAIYDMVSDYIKQNEFIEDGDGLYLTEHDEILMIPLSEKPVKDEGTFFPMETLVRETSNGMYPNVDAIENIIHLYIY